MNFTRRDMAGTMIQIYLLQILLNRGVSEGTKKKIKRTYNAIIELNFKLSIVLPQTHP